MPKCQSCETEPRALRASGDCMRSRNLPHPGGWFGNWGKMGERRLRPCGLLFCFFFVFCCSFYFLLHILPSPDSALGRAAAAPAPPRPRAVAPWTSRPNFLGPRAREQTADDGRNRAEKREGAGKGRSEGLERPSGGRCAAALGQVLG